MKSVAAVLCLLLGTLPALADQQADPRPITWANCSGSITNNNTAQSITVRAPLRGFIIQNPSTATESLFFEPNGTATTTTSLELQAGNSLSFGPGTIFAGTTPSVIAASSGHAFICKYGQ